MATMIDVCATTRQTDTHITWDAGKTWTRVTQL
jgi:hypothetical protein